MAQSRQDLTFTTAAATDNSGSFQTQTPAQNIFQILDFECLGSQRNLISKAVAVQCCCFSIKCHHCFFRTVLIISRGFWCKNLFVYQSYNQ